MKNNEEIVAIPYNDHAIFVDEYGLLSERVGIAWKKNKDIPDRLDNPYYIGDDDYWNSFPTLLHRRNITEFRRCKRKQSFKIYL